MRSLKEFPESTRRAVRMVLCDIDDTLTYNGRLPAVAYQALERLHEAGILVAPITGRPAGWCDHIARMWPVDALVGENGAFYFRYDHEKRVMVRRYFKADDERESDRKRLEQLEREILQAVPGAAVAADQAYRDTDLAIDFCEDVLPLEVPYVQRIVDLFEAAGAIAKISSIHVNGWFGDYDKLSMTRLLVREQFGLNLDEMRDQVVFAGDSPNDCPMFGYFPNSVGVANVRDFAGRLSAEPAWITEKPGGFGFAELAEVLLVVG